MKPSGKAITKTSFLFYLKVRVNLSWRSNFTRKVLIKIWTCSFEIPTFGNDWNAPLVAEHKRGGAFTNPLVVLYMDGGGEERIGVAMRLRGTHPPRHLCDDLSTSVATPAYRRRPCRRRIRRPGRPCRCPSGRGF